MPRPLALSPQAQLQCAHFGDERQPIMTIVDALPDPDQVIEIAARHRYAPHGPYYPGLRAPVSEAVAMPMVAPILDDLQKSFELKRPPRYRECFLSVVTVEPACLAPIQRLPHFDGTERERLAVLLYLDRKERGGTGFFRQRGTRFESVDDSRFDQYRQTLEAEVERAGLPEPSYIAGDTPLFEQVHRTAGMFNSMVVYRGNTLHCAALSRAFTPASDPARGRLTINLFLD